ncbi:MerR family transcriptional regulator [Paenibacillus sp. FSL W8-0186]|uniref:MerR family transcriptional regulator n=1 Tax=Paenibacillus woosongensis TaxID=307580 RepID=A0ABQ4ML03_9BACL|nr:MerR family transcriptional regulator [Paenibacillus woosongensis]GIP56657.1 MerR family transcriptional regulator [Paenibacillus woosongensis]
MLYTVKEVSSLSSVTVKTLHHYHKIGLLLPREISGAGYRLYGQKELERLQQILFYRELEFPLEQIKQLLERAPERLSVLKRQEELLLARQHRLQSVMATLRHSIHCMEKGESMDNSELFEGFDREEEWREALEEHNTHLQESYDFNQLESAQIDVQGMNEQAREAKAFMDEMARNLQAGVVHNSPEVEELICSHLEFMNRHGHAVSAQDFAGQTRFFLSDSFHLQMLEGQQTGLAYYLAAAAESYAAMN